MGVLLPDADGRAAKTRHFAAHAASHAIVGMARMDELPASATRASQADDAHEKQARMHGDGRVDRLCWRKAQAALFGRRFYCTLVELNAERWFVHVEAVDKGHTHGRIHSQDGASANQVRGESHSAALVVSCV